MSDKRKEGRERRSREISKQRARFLVKRAHALGETTSADMATAFGITSEAARKYVASALGLYPRLIQRNEGGRKVFRCGVTPPWAEIDVIIEELREGLPWTEVGVTKDEIGLLTTMPLLQDKPDAGTLRNVMDGIIRRFPIEIGYIDMKAGATEQRRLLMPFQLDVSGYRWDLHSIDMEKMADRTFVFSRITWARPMPANALKKSIIRRAEHKADKLRGEVLTEPVRMKLSPKLNEMQKSSLQKELGISSDVEARSVPSRRHMELRRLYGDHKVEGLVWPLVNIEPIKS